MKTNLFKRSLVTVLVLALTFAISACGNSKLKVNFDTQGGSSVSSVSLVSGEYVNPPADPTKSGYEFAGWYLNDADTNPFDFGKPITGSTKLVARWLNNLSSKQYYRFVDHRLNYTVAIVVAGSNGKVTPPTVTKEGFKAVQWFTSTRGKVWNEKTPVDFAVNAPTGGQTLYTYYEPVDSKAHTWTDAETYKTSFTEMDSDPILNPLVYKWSHESSLMSYLSTPLFSTDVNWDQAIKDGLAKYPGDFSTLDGSNIGSLLRENILVAAANYPVAIGGAYDKEDGTGQDGKYSEAIARDIYADTYEITIRKDLKWENGDPITAEDYVYSYFQYIDPIQANYRATGYYPDAGRTSGSRILNSRAYFLQGNKIGMGDNEEKQPSKADYAKYRVSRYLGEDNPYGAAYVNTWPFSSPAQNLYLTQAEADELGLVLGEGSLWPGGIDISAAAASSYDIRYRLTENPYYAGEKDTVWPAVAKSEVGFKVKDGDPYTFVIKFENAVSHSNAMSAASFTLLHRDTYEKSLDSTKTNSTYGTSADKVMSYGPFVIKTWDSLAKVVLNKNYLSINHTNFNYKSISFNFYSNEDQRMLAFENGLIDVTGLSQQYYANYLEDPNLKEFVNGYPQYLMFNTVEYDGQDPQVAEIIKMKEFRQAFFYGFDRIEYTTTIYAPNIPSMIVWPVNGTQYDNDPEWYTQTTEYQEMLASLGIDIATQGYDRVKAKALFDTAYAKWLANGNTGPIEINYLCSSGTIEERVTNYVTSHFTELFGSDKIKFNLKMYDANSAGDKQDSFEFDIVLTAVGYGIVYNTSVYLPIIGLYMRDLNGDGFGFNSMDDLGIPVEALEITEENKLDLTRTYQFLKDKLTSDNPWDETTDAGTLKALYDVLDVNNGYFVGSLDILYEFGLECTYIWAGLAPQYDGDVEDRNTVTRAFDRVILEWCPLVPTASRASAQVYSSAVTCEWPAYHNILEWGQSRYWYLNTDPDFKS